MFFEFLDHWQPFVVVFSLTLFWLWETVAPFFRFDHRSRHIVRNLALAAVNTFVIAIVFAGLVVATAEFARAQGLGLLRLSGLTSVPLILASFVLLDAATYWWHRLNHHVPFLWRFHRMHHSDPAVDVTTAARFHFGEIVFSSILRLAFIPLFGIPIEAIILFDVIQLPVIAFHHANIGLPSAVDRLLCLFVVTPFMHKVHHSREKNETDSNYSSILSIWDRVFGSFVERGDCRGIRFGLTSLEADAFQSIMGLLRTPIAQDGEHGSGRGKKVEG